MCRVGVSVFAYAIYFAVSLTAVAFRETCFPQRRVILNSAKKLRRFLRFESFIVFRFPLVVSSGSVLIHHLRLPGTGFFLPLDRADFRMARIEDRMTFCVCDHQVVPWIFIAPVLQRIFLRIWLQQDAVGAACDHAFCPPNP